MATNIHRINILRNVYKKLDGMMMSFGIPQYSDSMSGSDIERYLGTTLDDTMRELGITDIDNIDKTSTAAYYIENRCIYHKLRMMRNSASIFFKFSTAVDGKSIDKSMIPKMINEMLKEYDAEWKNWVSLGGFDGKSTSGVWNRESSDGTSWYRGMNE